MPPAYVKPYVKRQKNDAADAEAICEAVTRGTGLDAEGLVFKHPCRGLSLPVGPSKCLCPQEAVDLLRRSNYRLVGRPI
jgi:hypothetical protein